MPTLLPPAIVDDATRREFLAGLAAAGLLAACGDGGSDAQTTPPGPSRRTIEHPGGTSEVPVRPERVVTLSEVLDGHLASVGLLAVGVTDNVGEWLAPYRELLDPNLDLGALSEIGTAGEPNQEAIAGLDPDLILAEVFSEDLYPTLSQIAPTVLIERPTNAGWKGAFDATVDAVGRGGGAGADAGTARCSRRCPDEPVSSRVADPGWVAMHLGGRRRWSRRAACDRVSLP